MLKKIISFPKKAVTDLFAPARSFENILEKSNLAIIVRVMSIQIIMSILFISYMFNSPELYSGDSAEIVTYSFYGFVILIPLVFALITFPIHWAGTSLNGTGSFLDQYKLVLYSFFNSFVYMFIAGLLSVFLVSISDNETMKTIAYGIFMSQFGFLVYQLFVSIKVAHKFTWLRTLSAVILIHFGAALVYLSSLLMTR